ncbi:hypothetical protein MRB53_037169 [Persea americana]|nr:hypothetical protein MRB53_037169 [Persea americana]
MLIGQPRPDANGTVRVARDHGVTCDMPVPLRHPAHHHSFLGSRADRVSQNTRLDKTRHSSIFYCAFESFAHHRTAFTLTQPHRSPHCAEGST